MRIRQDYSSHRSRQHTENQVGDFSAGFFRMACSSPMLGNPMVPITRLATAMGDGNEEHEIGLYRVKNSVWKNTGQAAANVFVEPPPSQRVLEDHFNGVLHTDNEAQ